MSPRPELHAAGDTRSVTIVLVHGLWMRGPDMLLLRWRLRQAGFRIYQFSYATTKLSFDEVIDRLHDFVEHRVPEHYVHFVAHSLGGNVVHEYVHRHPSTRFERVVALGTPFQSSIVAQHLMTWSLGKLLLGRIAEGGLLPARASWSATTQLGVIAGDGGVGMGRWVCALPKPHDGTVGVAETRIDGAASHLVLPVSHMQLLVHNGVARQVVAFLRTGAFLR